LIYSKDHDGDENFQLYRFDIDTKASTLLTDGKSRNLYPAWSNSGKWLAYSSTRRNGKDMDVYILDSLNPKSDHELVRFAGEDWAVFNWSPDDTKVILSDYRSPNETYLWVMNIATGIKTLLTPNEKGETAFNGSYAYFDKSGTGVYFSSDRASQFRRLVFVSLASHNVVCLTPQINWDVDEFSVSPDRRLLAFISNEAGIGRLHMIDLATSKERPLPDLQPGVASGLIWSSDSSEIGFGFESSKSPADVFSVRVKDNALERWTTGQMGVDPAGFKDPELIRWKSFDGVSISGFIYRPPSSFAGKRPVIIDIHGGPYVQFRPTFLPEDNYFVNELGVVLIHPNIRGSLGYGKEFLRLDDGVLRDNANRDVGAILDWISSQPDLDADRVMVEGGSHGGYVALSVAWEYPKKVAAALSYVGLANLATFMERDSTYEVEEWRREYGDEPGVTETGTRGERGGEWGA
jgi:dipeptidyl aminopeptidase/acylaminoacyl peptidase